SLHGIVMLPLHHDVLSLGPVHSRNVVASTVPSPGGSSVRRSSSPSRRPSTARHSKSDGFEAACSCCRNLHALFLVYEFNGLAEIALLFLKGECADEFICSAIVLSDPVVTIVPDCNATHEAHGSSCNGRCQHLRRRGRHCPNAD